MDFFDLLSMVGGLSLFLFGMDVMGKALERRAGKRLSGLLGKMTTNKLAGIATGLGVTAVIQSSSAATVMVVGFVNSGLMNLKQAVNVIMGANIGTTVTAWVLSLAGIDSKNFWIRMLKPTSFTPILALIGIVFYLFWKDAKKRDTGSILLGFAVLMFGMDTMSGAVSGLSDVPAFRDLFLLFEHPVLGAFAGAALTAVIQSSSASVGILQALAVTGQISFGAAVPIIMGQNIGTCVTAMLSSIGANRNAKRAALIHLSFNVLGTAFWLTVFCAVKLIYAPPLLNAPATLFGIAASHSAFNILCTLLLLPLSGMLERLVCRMIPDAEQPPMRFELDERLLGTPSIALESCQNAACDMAVCVMGALKDSLLVLKKYSPKLAEKIRMAEEKTDHYEDMLGTYLVKLSAKRISVENSNEAAKLLKMIGDFERISDHAVNIVASVEELEEKNLHLSKPAKAELSVLLAAVGEALDLSFTAFLENDLQTAGRVEPLDEVIGGLKEIMRTNHILRLQKNQCGIGEGFVWSDLLTDLERVSGHCANIAGCVIDMAMGNLNLHESVREIKKDNPAYQEQLLEFAGKYVLALDVIPDMA